MTPKAARFRPLPDAEQNAEIRAHLGEEFVGNFEQESKGVRPKSFAGQKVYFGTSRGMPELAKVRSILRRGEVSHFLKDHSLMVHDLPLETLPVITFDR